MNRRQRVHTSEIPEHFCCIHSSNYPALAAHEFVRLSYTNVIGIDKDPVNGSLSLTAQVRARAVGDKVNLTIIRGGKQMTITVTLAARPSSGG